MKYTASFVCQSGFIEVQSLLLATSLRRHLQGEFEIVAAVPRNFGKLDAVTEKIFDSLGVETRYFENTFSPVFYMANKPYAANLVGKNILFVDSDALLMKPFHPDYLPACDVFAFAEDPFLAYAPSEWEAITALFQVQIPPCPPDQINLQCMNTPMFYSRIDLGGRWLDFTRRLHTAVHQDKIKMVRKRKIANMCFGMAVRSLGVDFHVSEPLTWNGDPNWWSYPKCECHEWEKRLPVAERTYNPYLSVPDLVYYDDGGSELACHGKPYFYCLQNGFGYCPIHQGGTSKKIGLWMYPEIRRYIYSLLSDVPLIDHHPRWSDYLSRYVDNRDDKWFQKPAHYGVKQ